MKYIWKEIESEEEFIEVFGVCPSWILSPVKLSHKHCGSKTEEDQPEKDDTQQTTD